MSEKKTFHDTIDWNEGKDEANEPGSVKTVTYTKDKSSKSSMRSREKPLQSKRDRKKKDRKLMSSLFGTDDSLDTIGKDKKQNQSPSKQKSSIKMRSRGN